MRKYGILLLEGLTKENAELYQVVSPFTTNIILKEGRSFTDKNNRTQKEILEWASGIIVEWLNQDDTLQQKAITDSKASFNSGRSVKITDERLIVNFDETELLGK